MVFFNDRSCQRHLAIVRGSGLVPTSRSFGRISASAFGRSRAKPSFLRVRFHGRIAALPPVESLHLSHLKKVFEQQTLWADRRLAEVHRGIVDRFVRERFRWNWRRLSCSTLVKSSARCWLQIPQNKRNGIQRLGWTTQSCRRRKNCSRLEQSLPW